MIDFLRHDDLDFAFDLIKRICTEIGPGSPCSAQEHARAAVIKAEMSKVADDVKIENFHCAPNAFYGWFKVASILAVLGAAFFYLSLLPACPIVFSAAGLVISLIMVSMTLFEFILFKEFADFLFHARQSSNVVGAIEPKSGQRADRILIFGGHHDSALKFTYLHRFKLGYYIVELILVGSILATVVFSGLRFASLAFSLHWAWIVTTMKWMSWTLLPIGAFLSFTFTERAKNGGSVPGALDNLSAVSVVLALGRILKRHPELHPPNTEIRLISFGSEEAGVRGSRAYVRAHEHELKSADTEFINFETLFDPEMIVFKGDRNATMRNSKETVDRLSEAAWKAHVPFKVMGFPFGGGGTDAIAFLERGLKAACVFGMKIPSQMIQFYHQPSDNYDLVNKEALGNALKIAVEYLGG